jgi:hypothetical protein
MNRIADAKVSPSDPQANEVTDDHWNARCHVRHCAYVSYRYHRHRQRFFDLLDKGTKSLTVVLGATLIGDTLKQYAPLAASAIAALGLLALVFGYGDRKQMHKELAEVFMNLIGTIEATPASALADSVIGAWNAEYARLNAKEPPTLRTLVIICEHEQALAAGHPDNVPLPPRYRRLIADFVG